jgi:multidrug efflux system membrane fusion protein
MDPAHIRDHASFRAAWRRSPAILAFALGLAGCDAPEQTPPPKPPRPVKVATVHYVQETTTARYSGEVMARHETPLAFQVAGKLARRLVDVGSVVRRGDLLASLDPADYELNRASAAAQLASAQAELALARRDSQHLGNLLDKNLASPASHERKEDAARAAQARVQHAQAALDLAARQLSYTALRAEQDGVVTAALAEAGQVLAAGQAVVRLAVAGEREVAINVPENRLDKLQAATRLQATLWAEPGAYFPARIREVSPGVDAVLRTYTVKVALPESDPRVRLGMTATVLAHTTRPNPVAVLPLTALRREQGRPAVWVVDGNSGSLVSRPVTVERYDTASAILADGVAEGEQVVVAGVHKLAPGEKVRAVAAE